MMGVKWGSCFFFFIFSVPGSLDRSSFRSCFSIALALARYRLVDVFLSGFLRAKAYFDSNRLDYYTSPPSPGGVDLVHPLSISSFGRPTRLHFMMNVRHTELETRLRSSV